MQGTSPEDLNERFGIAGRLLFAEGPGELPVARVSSDHAEADICLLGAQVLSYCPWDAEDVLWVSEKARYQPGKPIRGGIPVCWPWFALHPDDVDLPLHGFVRTRTWRVSETNSVDDRVLLTLTTRDTPETHELWPHEYRLDLTVSVGAELKVSLAVSNPGENAFTYSGALHSYFRVGDVRRIAIEGLEGCEYLDKTEGFARRTQAGPVTINDEVDRVYPETAAECIIDDPVMERRIHVGKTGSLTTVVWNPWKEVARKLEDFGDDEYAEMVCVETANAHGDEVEVAPGAEYRVGATIRLE